MSFDRTMKKLTDNLQILKQDMDRIYWELMEKSKGKTEKTEESVDEVQKAEQLEQIEQIATKMQSEGMDISLRSIQSMTVIRKDEEAIKQAQENPEVTFIFDQITRIFTT